MSRRVCIDARMIDASGIGTYLRGLLSGLQKISHQGIEFTLLGDPDRLPEGPWNSEKAYSKIYSIREQIEIPVVVRRCRADLLHSPHYNLPAILVSRCVVTVHDLIHLKFPEFWPSMAARLYARVFFKHLIPRAKAILTVSENTKRDLMEMASISSDRITVTYPAVQQDFAATAQTPSADWDRLDLPPDYLLYVGNLKEFKNVPKLLAAYRQLKTRCPSAPSLVLAGRNFIPGFEQEIRDTPSVRWIGEVPRELLSKLYTHAAIFIFPSLYEGFGLPPLEAMACGTPVICSNRASLPEVVGEAALLIDPEKTDAITAALERLLKDAVLRREMADKGLRQASQFSWKTMAEQTLQVYQRCLS